ncbi:MAG: helicase-related protein [Nitrospira sp.]|nr:helicase-related protein [Nitrospira sp.]
MTVLTGEGLQHLFSEENIVELGRRKGTFLLAVLDVLNQRDHIILCSPDLLGYVAQRCYSVTGNFYNTRWRDELELKLAEHQVVIDEYHFYDPYTYLNLSGALEKLGTVRWLCLSATGRSDYFSDADTFDPGGSTAASPAEERIASHPIELYLHRDDIRIVDRSPQHRVIYFYHSVIAVHETAEALRSAGTRLIEWTGIQKTHNDEARLVVATSAAEVGLDLPFREVHTEFWGNNWEVSSIIQRIGRVGRSDEAGRSQAHIWITGREPGLLFSLLNNKSTLTKGEFGELLLKTFGELAFRPEDYVSYYLWDEDKVRALRRFWQVPPEVRKLRFHFRPPNSQAVFNWHGTRFAYDWVPIANRYQLESVADLTDLPFWHEMGYSEWRVAAPLEKREYHQRYEGKKDKEHRRCFWESGNR